MRNPARSDHPRRDATTRSGGFAHDCSPVRLLTCPVCALLRVRIVAELPKMRVCLCEACSAEFTIARRPDAC